MTTSSVPRSLHRRPVRAWFGEDRLLTHNLVVGSGTVVAGILGIAFQSMASHQLHPADYGQVFAVVTLITLIGVPASAFTLLMARETSRGRASGEEGAGAALLRGGNRALLLLGLGIAAVVVLLAPLLAGTLAVSPSLLIAGAAGVPFAVALPFLLGELQGEQRFNQYAAIAVGQAGLKLAAAFVGGLVFGAAGIVAGISIAAAAVYGVCLWLLRQRLMSSAGGQWWRPAAGYLAIVLPSTIALGVLVSADVLLVKHYFASQAAGEYSAVAALGRAAYWGSSGVALVLFPKIALRGAQGRPGRSLVAASLLLVAAGGLSFFVLLTPLSSALLTAFAGGAYAGGAAYLPWYAPGMLLLGGTAVLVAAHQSRGRPAFLAVLLPLAALEPLLIVLLHGSLVQVIQVVDISMLLAFVGLGVMYMAQER